MSSTLCSWIYLCTLRSAVLVCIYAVCDIDWKDSGTDRLEIKAGFYISNVSHNKGVYSPSLVKWRMPILMLGCKGLLLQMRPFPLIEKRFREKKNLCGPRKQVINIWKGHKTNYTRAGSCWRSFSFWGHTLQFAFVLKTTSCLWLYVQYFLKTLVVERKKKWRVYHRWLNQLGDANNSLFYSELFYSIPVYGARNYGNNCVFVLSQALVFFSFLLKMQALLPFYPSFLLTLLKIIWIPILCTVCWV